MTNKVVKYTLADNSHYPTVYESKDNDVYVNSNILVSDIEYTEAARNSAVIRQNTFDLDMTKDIVLKSTFSTVTGFSETVNLEYNVTLSPQGGNNWNVIAKANEQPVSEYMVATYGTEMFDNWVIFKINGVEKGRKDDWLTGWTELGTHAITWNGTDALTLEFDASQKNLNDSTCQMAPVIKFEIT